MQRYRSSGRARGRTACSPGERLTAVLLASWWDLNPGAPGQRRNAQLRTRETMVNRGWHSSVPMEERMGQHAGARRHSAPRCRPRDLACAGMRDHGVAALISWLVTAFVGLFLLAVWLIENDVTHRGAAASRLPAPAPGCAQDVRAERGVRLGQLPGAQRLDHRHPGSGPAQQRHVQLSLRAAPVPGCGELLQHSSDGPVQHHNPRHAGPDLGHGPYPNISP
jgi:hypothetical protein